MASFLALRSLVRAVGVVAVGVAAVGVAAVGTAVAAGSAVAAAVKHRLGRLAVWDRLVAAAAGAASAGAAAVGVAAVGVAAVGTAVAVDGVVGNLWIKKAGCGRPRRASDRKGN
jgi:hypothetical protein